MPRYLIERSFPEGLNIPTDAEGAEAIRGVVERNADEGVSRVHSYVSPDKKKTFCVYDGPTPESIREVAGMSNMPVGNITAVSVLDPYFYRS